MVRVLSAMRLDVLIVVFAALFVLSEAIPDRIAKDATKSVTRTALR